MAKGAGELKYRRGGGMKKVTNQKTLQVVGEIAANLKYVINMP